MDSTSAAAPLLLAQAAPDAFVQFVPLALILAVFYFLLIRPQQQKAREHEDYLKGLKRGELVITQSGLFGRVVELRDQDVTLEIAPNVKVRYERSKIAGSAGTAVPKAE
ncbi:MAG TPA: preprotein translocase subunit YajC [Candidatus Binatia bacterium]|jgi:preprotein translocase subunit YajC